MLRSKKELKKAKKERNNLATLQQKIHKLDKKIELETNALIQEKKDIKDALSSLRYDLLKERNEIVSDSFLNKVKEFFLGEYEIKTDKIKAIDDLNKTIIPQMDILPPRQYIQYLDSQHYYGTTSPMGEIAYIPPYNQAFSGLSSRTQILFNRVHAFLGRKEKLKNDKEVVEEHRRKMHDNGPNILINDDVSDLILFEVSGEDELKENHVVVEEEPKKNHVIVDEFTAEFTTALNDLLNEWGKIKLKEDRFNKNLNDFIKVVDNQIDELQKEINDLTDQGQISLKQQKKQSLNILAKNLFSLSSIANINDRIRMLSRQKLLETSQDELERLTKAIKKQESMKSAYPFYHKDESSYKNYCSNQYEVRPQDGIFLPPKKLTYKGIRNRTQSLIKDDAPTYFKQHADLERQKKEYSKKCEKFILKPTSYELLESTRVELETQLNEIQLKLNSVNEEIEQLNISVSEKIGALHSEEDDFVLKLSSFNWIKTALEQELSPSIIRNKIQEWHKMPLVTHSSFFIPQTYEFELQAQNALEVLTKKATLLNKIKTIEFKQEELEEITSLSKLGVTHLSEISMTDMQDGEGGVGIELKTFGYSH